MSRIDKEAHIYDEIFCNALLCKGEKEEIMLFIATRYRLDRL